MELQGHLLPRAGLGSSVDHRRRLLRSHELVEDRVQLLARSKGIKASRSAVDEIRRRAPRGLQQRAVRDAGRRRT